MQATMERPNLAGLLNSVCKIETEDKSSRYSGHGVFLLPDLVLTSWHVISGSRKVNIIANDGRSAEIVRGSPYAKKSSDLDLAIVEISRALTSDVAMFTDSEANVRSMDGYLATAFGGMSKCHKAGIDVPSSIMNMIKIGSWRREFLADHAVVAGYSGSPVFDARGKLVSVVTTNSADRKGSTREVEPSHEYPGGLYRFQGPSPMETAKFIRRALDFD